MKIKFIAKKKLGIYGVPKMVVIERNTEMEVVNETATCFVIKDESDVQYSISKQADEIRKIDDDGHLYI